MERVYSYNPGARTGPLNTNDCKNYFLILASSLPFDVCFLKVAAVRIALVYLASIRWFTEVFPLILVTVSRCPRRAEWRRSTSWLIHVFRVTVNWSHCIVHCVYWVHFYNICHLISLCHLAHDNSNTTRNLTVTKKSCNFCSIIFKDVLWQKVIKV